ncbi:MAG: tail fiber domain-containing protein [Saprospiraceae bacterium]
MIVGLVASGGVAQAQYTGIGHTNPQATLHVVPVTVGQEPLIVEGVIDITPAEVTGALYSDLMLLNPATGIFRRESVADLLDNNGEWVVVGGELVPRNAPFNGDIALTGTGINITVPTNITGATAVTGTFGVTGNSTLTGTLGVSGNTALGGTLSVAGETTLTTVNDLALNVNATDQILFHGPGGVVQKADVSDVLADLGQWIIVGGELVPRETDYNGDIAFTGTIMDVNVPTEIAGTFDVVGNSVLTGTLNVTAAADFDNTVNIDNTLSIGTVAQVLVGDIIPTDEILMQQAGTNLVEYVTVGDLLASNSYWDEDSNVLTPSNAAIEDEMRIADGDVDITATNVDITGIFGVTGNSTFTGTVNATGAADFDATVNVDGNTNLEGTLDIGTVAVATTVVGADEVLFQAAGTDLVQSITVTNLLAESSYWDLDSDVLTPSATAIEDEMSIADGDVDITAADIDFVGANVDVTGAFGVTGNSTLSGTLNVTNDADFDTNVNVDGNTVIDGTLSIGTVAEITGTLAAADEILLQRAGTDLVEYVTVEDLVSSNSEWSYSDIGTVGVLDAGDRIYVRRLGNDAGGNDVYVDAVGNMVVDATKAFQFGAATDQINATGITATANYTMALSANLAINAAGSIAVTSGANEDVSFSETGAGVPWLFYAADDSYTPTNSFGTEVGRVGINTNSPEATLHVAGNIVASNSTVSSDRRFKKDIKELSGALDLVKALRGVSYDFRTGEFPKENFDDRNHIGFIAQEIQEVLPQTVFARGDGFLTVDYAAVTPVLVEALQELSKQVEALQAENATLRSTSEKSIGAVSTKQLRDLEARLADMDARLQEVAGRK